MKSLENIVNGVKKSLRGLAFATVIGTAVLGVVKDAKADVNSNSIIHKHLNLLFIFFSWNGVEKIWIVKTRTKFFSEYIFVYNEFQ